MTGADPKRRGLSAAVGTLALVLGLYPAQDRRRDLPPEEHTAQVRLVLVDVIVTKDGRFVPDLDIDDFELFDDGRKVPVLSLELVSFSQTPLGNPPAQKSPAPNSPAKQRVVFLFDAINSRAKDVERLKDEAARELTALAEMGADVMVLQLTWDQGLEIVQPFTARAELIQSAVGDAFGTPWESGSQLAVPEAVDPLLDETDAASELTDYIWQQQYADHRLLEKDKLEKTLGGILTACQLLKEFRGRKSVLLISSGIPDLITPNPARVIPTGSTAVRSSSRETLDAIHTRDFGKDKVRIHDPLNLLEEEVFESGKQATEALIRFANTSNISIYSLAPVLVPVTHFTGSTAEYRRREDMRHLRFNSYEAAGRLQTLESLSKRTSAVSLRGADKIADLRALIREDLSFYYLLSYAPPRERADDGYHTIKVKVRRKGLNVRSRRGYIDTTREREKRMRLASALFSPELYRSLPFYAEFVPFYRDIDRIEPWICLALPCGPLFLERPFEMGTRSLELHIRVRESGNAEKGFSSLVPLPFDVDSGFLERLRALENLKVFFKGPAVPMRPREQEVTMALFDPRTDEIGTWRASLKPPDRGALGDTAVLNCVLGTVVENPAVREASFRLDDRDGGLAAGSLKFFPAVPPSVPGAETPYIFLQVLMEEAPGTEKPAIAVKGGDGIWKLLPTEVEAETWDREAKIWNALIRLPLSGAEAGDIILSVEVPNAAGSSLSARQLFFKIRD
jgi:VWFA-related protein